MPKRAHRRTDHRRAEAERRRRESGGRLPEAGDHPGDVLPWKRQYAGLGVQELPELRQLREENGRLKRLVADLSLDWQILQDIVARKL